MTQDLAPSASVPLFLLGAGFNADARTEAGRVYGHVSKREIQCSYPLAADLAQRCFDLASLPAGKSIEQLFQEAAEADKTDKADKTEPLDRLIETITEADNYLIPVLREKVNCYSEFFRRFSNSSFLTFNYDSLPELFLLKQGRWYPHDGYGVQVELNLDTGDEHLRKCSSGSLVLHLHGSLCLYTSTFTTEPPKGRRSARLKEREQPRYLFDPDSIALLFSPFEPATMVSDYQHPLARIIAPVPDKAEGLREKFIQEVYKRAAALISASGIPLVVIGYSFNKHDHASFHPILSAVERNAAGRVLIVQPEAVELQRRMMSEYPSISWAAEPRTFASWVKAGFPGVGNEGRAGRLARD